MPRGMSRRRRRGPLQPRVMRHLGRTSVSFPPSS
jgi:hypothetical protein